MVGAVLRFASRMAPFHRDVLSDCQHPIFASESSILSSQVFVQHKFTLKSTPWKINMEPENDGLEDYFPFQWVIFRFHVNLPGVGVWLWKFCWEAIAPIGSIWLDQDLGYVWVVVSNIFYIFSIFHPKPWGNDPIWQTYFFNGLVQPPTRYHLWIPKKNLPKTTVGIHARQHWWATGGNWLSTRVRGNSSLTMRCRGASGQKWIGDLLLGCPVGS